MPTYEFSKTDIPEYLEMFPNQSLHGVKVRVKFSSKEDKGRKIREFCSEWSDLLNLFNYGSGQPFKSIRIDSYLCPISKIEINPNKNLAVIHVGDTGISEMGGVDEGVNETTDLDLFEGFCTDEEATCEIALLKERREKSMVSIYCVIDAIKEIRIKSGELMGFCSASDNSGSTELVVFADVYQRVAELLKTDDPLFVTGSLEISEERGAKIMVDDVKPLARS